MIRKREPNMYDELAARWGMDREEVKRFLYQGTFDAPPMPRRMYTPPEGFPSAFPGCEPPLRLRCIVDGREVDGEILEP